jgi:hypothetical protein
METQQATTTQPVTLANQSIPVTSLLTPISYAIAAVIVLAGLGAFLRTIFSLGKD